MDRGPQPDRRRALPVIFLAGLVLFFAGRLMTGNLILARGDAFLYFYPYWTAAAAAIRAGHLPLWNPDLFMGAPLLANSQMGFFYPLNWPLWLVLPVPYALSASVALHLYIAAAGAYLAARRAQRLSPTAALLSAMLFGLGGYVTAQIEHINQLQALAWFPWLLAVLAPAGGRSGRRVWLSQALGLAALFTLQFLAGHTQTLFLSLVGLVIWLVATAWMAPDGGTPDPAPRRLARSLGILGAGGLMALLMAGVQLAPTLELAGLSSRQGGLTLNEVLSFSLHPLLLGRSLLPGYRQAIFTEYVAHLPLAAWWLAIIGGGLWRRHPRVRPLVVVSVAGFLLALGQFNPVYWVLGQAPGFDLFRAPARWLLLAALAASLLAGHGWDRVTGPPLAGSSRPAGYGRSWLAGLVFLLALMAWSVLAPGLAGLVPSGSEAPIEPPGALTGLGWWLELGLAALLLAPARPDSRRRAVAGLARFARRSGPVLVGLCLIVLYLAGLSLPFSHPTAPEAYFDLRPPVARLLAENDCRQADCSDRARSGAAPPGRFLSLSPIFFDLGDQAEIDSIYDGRLSTRARFDYLVAVKQKEILAPNLSLLYGLNAVDGFDGGLLPLQAYTELSRLLLPSGRTTTDGRLRENLPELPAGRWLDLFHVRHVITDKVGDVWRQAGGLNVFFDRQHGRALPAGKTLEVGYLPDYEATALWLLGEGPIVAEVSRPDTVGQQLNPVWLEPDLGQYELEEPARPTAIRLRCAAAAGMCQVAGLALVDRRDGSFHTLVPGAYRLIYSGDVKIYENLDAQPRAWLASRWQWQPDVTRAVEVMANPTFDPRQEAVVIGDGPPSSRDRPAAAAPVFRLYQAEQIRLQATTRDPALLVLSDAYYPGWRAQVNGEPVPLYQVNGLFRGLFLPPGEHEVSLTYRPVSVRLGQILTVLGLGMWLTLAWFWRRTGRDPSRAASLGRPPMVGPPGSGDE